MPPSPSVSRPVPRGLARTGPVLFSYGFRPFFLGGALYRVPIIVDGFISATAALVASLLR